MSVAVYTLCADNLMQQLNKLNEPPFLLIIQWMNVLIDTWVIVMKLKIPNPPLPSPHLPSTSMPRTVLAITVKRELSLQQATFSLSFRWVNILHAWTVNSVNRLVKNPKHIIQQSPFHPSLPKSKLHLRHMQASSLVCQNNFTPLHHKCQTTCLHVIMMRMGKHQGWMERWLLSCTLDS